MWKLGSMGQGACHLPAATTYLSILPPCTVFAIDLQLKPNKFLSYINKNRVNKHTNESHRVDNETTNDHS